MIAKSVELADGAKRLRLSFDLSQSTFCEADVGCDVTHAKLASYNGNRGGRNRD
jgi:hypothetical protein